MLVTQGAGCTGESVTLRDMKNEHLTNTGCSSLEGNSDNFDKIRYFISAYTT